MACLNIGCGYNPCFKTGSLTIPDYVTHIELGIKEYIEWSNDKKVLSQDLSLHIARSPITEVKIKQKEFIKHLKDVISAHNKGSLILKSIGFHLSGERNFGIGALGFTSHFTPTNTNIERAIQFIVDAQLELNKNIWIENSNLYSSSSDEIFFMWNAITEICTKSNCGLIIDLSHLFIDFSNVGLDPVIILGIVPWQYVKEIHLSGIILGRDGIYHDGHSQTISQEIWNLFTQLCELMVCKNIHPIVTLEHSDLVWGTKKEEYYKDFKTLKNIIDQMDRKRKSKINKDIQQYAVSHIYKTINSRYCKLIDFINNRLNIDAYVIVSEWIKSLSNRNLRLTFDIHEVTPSDRDQTVELSDFILFVERNYAVRN